MNRVADSAVATPSLGFFTRLKAFADNVFEPKLHTFFAAFWSISLLGNLHVVSGVHAWRVDATLFVLVFSVFTCLFFLRMVDEIKDYEYDVVHNPGRPLVSGLVTRSDVARYLVVFAIVVLALNSLIALPLAACVALDMLYGIFQLPLEQRSRAVREKLLVNLAAVYPVNVGLSVYTLLYFLTKSGAAFDAKQVLLILAYACAFLHFEFARKTAWPHLAEKGERLYSQEIGLDASLALSTGFGVFAPLLVVWLFAPWTQTGAAAVLGWSPLLVLAPMTLGLVRFARNRTRRHAARPPAVMYLFAFYITMFVHAVAVESLAWGR